jgi:hypothetical protein
MHSGNLSKALGIVVVIFVLFILPRAEAVDLTSGPNTASDIQKPFEDPVKSINAQQREISLLFAGSTLWQGIYSAAGSGDYAYAYPYFGLQVIDMSDPGNPVIVGEFYHPVTPEDMVVDGDFVYVAAGAQQLLIFDVSDPYSPVMANTIESYSNPHGIEIIGTTAYISADEEFLIVDISDPYSPEILQSFDPGGSNARHAVIVGDYSYIAADYSLEIWDLSIIESPYNVSHKFIGRDNWDIVMADNIAYVLDRKSGLYLLNLSNPPFPVALGSWEDTSSYLRDVEIAGDYSYVTSSSSIRIIDVSDPWNPQFSSSWPALGENTGTYIDENDLFISDWRGGVSRYDISSPATPTLEAVFESPGMGHDLALSGDFAYEANGAGGMQVLDMSDPENPTVIGSYDTPGETWSVEVIGHYAYLADDFIGTISPIHTR